MTSPRALLRSRFRRAYLAVIFGAVEREDRFAIFDPESREWLGPQVSTQGMAWYKAVEMVAAEDQKRREAKYRRRMEIENG
jgi:hypothetical protein